VISSGGQTKLLQDVVQIDAGKKFAFCSSRPEHFRRFVGMATLLAGCGQDAYGVDNLMFHVVP